MPSIEKKIAYKSFLALNSAFCNNGPFALSSCPYFIACFPYWLKIKIQVLSPTWMGCILKTF